MYCRELARIAGAIVRGVYVPRVNHLGVISWPLAPIDITAIDCDLLPNVVQLQFSGHWRLLALQGHLLTRGLAFARITSLTTTNDDQVIKLSQPDISVASFQQQLYNTRLYNAKVTQ